MYALMKMREFNQGMLKDGEVDILQVVLLQIR